MKFTPAFQQGTLIKRYKRFLADITTETGEQLTIHCPNTGSMRGVLAPGEPIWYSTTASATRKYPHTWEIATTPAGDLAGINTHRANALVREAIEAGLLEQFDAVNSIQAEVKFGSNSRADFKVATPSAEWLVEVKNVTLLEQGCGFFPDAISERGRKHLEELTRSVAAGAKAMLIYCVQHTGINRVAPAAHIDERYANAFYNAVAAGVECVALKASIDPSEIRLGQAIDVVI